MSHRVSVDEEHSWSLSPQQAVEMRVILDCTLHSRVPEPLRLAHRTAAEALRCELGDSLDP